MLTYIYLFVLVEMCTFYRRKFNERICRQNETGWHMGGGDHICLALLSQMLNIDIVDIYLSRTALNR